jgi:hypothetical protein
MSEPDGLLFFSQVADRLEAAVTTLEDSVSAAYDLDACLNHNIYTYV